jgi:hypothetical protein
VFRGSLEDAAFCLETLGSTWSSIGKRIGGDYAKKKKKG